MIAKVTLDKAGRVVIPKPLRDKLQLGPGDSLELDNQGELITLRLTRTTAPLQKERGVWVYRTGQKFHASTATNTLRQIRDERDLAALGRDR
jgi:AbrB family looped-hinge helix DNA binding protein